MVSRRVLAFSVALSLAFVALPAASQQTASAGTKPKFVKNVINPFFPLVPGTTFYYEGEKDGVPTRDVVAVTSDVKRITGVDCIVVHDSAYENNVLVEDTFDYYAHDSTGNVWYFGEDTKELAPVGTVISTEGTWQAGVNGGQPGIIMEANPRVGDRYYQEFSEGVAEDQAQVLSLDKEACVKYGCFDDLQLTKEWSRLSPGELDHKYYARGVGFILEDMVAGGPEHSELVRITHGTTAVRN